MKRRFMLLATGLILVGGLGLLGCSKRDAEGGKLDPSAVVGSKDSSGMPPEARKAMEEAMKNKGGPPKNLPKGASGPPAGASGPPMDPNASR